MNGRVETWSFGRARGLLAVGLAGVVAISCEASDSPPPAAADAPVDGGASVDAGDATDAAWLDAGAPDAAAPDDAAGGKEDAAPLGPAGSWTRTFTDEFDGDSLDATKWNAGWFTSGTSSASPPVNADELQFFSPDAILFPGDGAVHLRLSPSASNDYGKAYQSGMIQSSNRFTFDPTKERTVLESRIRVPGPDVHAAGYWPAFWILSNENSFGQGSTWPPEIDIFEFFGTSTEPMAHLHTTGDDINKGFVDSSGVDLSKDFHVYTFDVSASALAFYLDGVQKWTYADAEIIARSIAPAPLYVLLNFAYGGGGGGAPNASSVVPADMVVDYVRVWTAK